ncbi:MAG: hypothetical protein AB7I41_18985 [Candidatus Sericytochromatia bacterium]
MRGMTLSIRQPVAIPYYFSKTEPVPKSPPVSDKTLAVNLTLPAQDQLPKAPLQGRAAPVDAAVSALFDQVITQLEQAPEATETLKISLGDQILEIPFKQLDRAELFHALGRALKNFQPQETPAGLAETEQMAAPLVKAMLSPPVVAQKELTEKQTLTALAKFPPQAVTPENFSKLTRWLAVYNASSQTSKPALPPALIANLETLFVLEAAKKSPAEQQKLLSMLPDLDASDLQLFKARGSLALLGQLKDKSASLTTLPKELRETLTHQVNQFLKMSGSSLQLTSLKQADLSAAVKELESELGLPISGSLSVENLRQIEKAQKNLFVIQSNVRNIVHDEILEGPNRTEILEKSLGKGEVINQKVALQNLQVLRKNYFWLTDKRLPTDKFSLDLYFDTMKARQSWLSEKQETQSHHHIYTTQDARLVGQLLQNQPRQRALFGDLAAMAADGTQLTLKQRAAVQKLLDNPKLFDYTFSIHVGDKEKNGKVDMTLHPENREYTYLSADKLQALVNVLALEKVKLGEEGNLQGIYLPEFVDGREQAAKIYNATNYEGDGFWAALGATGWGTDETTLMETLKNAQASRGQIMALKRDYERMYQSSLKEEIEDELGGGLLGEALAYEASPGEDMIAEQQVGSGKQAEFMLAKFKPMIDQIGADNGVIAWSVGHSKADHLRQTELNALYTEAKSALQTWQASPNDPALEKKLLLLTSKILIRLQADSQADDYYTQSKDSAVAVAKNVAIVATATVVTVATAGAGAPLLAAAAAGTAAGTAVAFTGEASDQLGTYLGESHRNAIAQQITTEQTANVAAIQTEDSELKTRVLAELASKTKGLQQAQSQRQVFDTDQLWQATFEGFKTSLVTSVTTVATMGMTQFASAGKVKAAFESMGKAGNLSRQMLINGLSGVTGDAAGQILAPLHLKKHDKAGAQAVISQMTAHLTQNTATINALEKEKTHLQAKISAFYNSQGSEKSTQGKVTQITTLKIKQPSEAEVKALFANQLRLQELEGVIKDLGESNQVVQKDIEKIEKSLNSASPLEWNSDEWQQITEHLGRNLAISFVAGAALNLINGNKLVSRLAFNTASSATETLARNAIEKYVDGKANKDLFEGMVQNVLTSLIAGEANNLIQQRQMAKMGLNSTAEGRLMQQLKADDNPTTRNLQGLLSAAGFKAEAPETHGPAVAKVLQNHPEFSGFVNGQLHKQRISMAQEFSKQIAETAQKAHPQADAEKTVTRFWEAQEHIYLLEQKKQSLADTPDSPDKVLQLGEIDKQQQNWKNTAEAIATGKQAVDAQGKVMGEQIAPETPTKVTLAEVDQPIKPLPSPEPSPRTRELASRLEVIAQGDPAGLRKIQQVLGESAAGIGDDLKAEFLTRVESRLKDPHFQGKSVFEVMKSVVKDDPALFTKKGEKVPLSVLQAEGTFSRVVTMTAVYREYMSEGTRQNLKDQFGIANDKAFAARVKQDPSFFRLDMLNPEALISGGNDTAWWSPKGQSEAKTTSALAQEVAVDPKRFESGTLRLSIEPEALFEMGLRKPTALDGMFEEWREVGADEALGRTDQGNKSEGVIGGIPLNKMGSIEIFSAQGRIQLNLETVERSQRLQEAVALRGGKPELVEAGQKKIHQILNEAASGITAEIKAEFFKRVEGALQDPKYKDKSVFEVMQQVVSDDPKLFTKQGERIPLDALKAEGTFSRVVTMTAVYREFMSEATRARLKDEFGITNDKAFAAHVKADPSFFSMKLIDPNALISGGNETGWWSVKGQSEAQSTEALAQELAVDPKRYEAGTLRFSIEPEVLYQAEVRKPTALDGMFKEWVDVPPDQVLGKTEGNKSEGVVFGVPLQQVGSIEYFTQTGRLDVNDGG